MFNSESLRGASNTHAHWFSLAFAFFLMLFGTMGCSEEIQEPEGIAELGIEVTEASIAAKEVLKSYLNSEVGRVSQDISIDDLIRVVDHESEKVIYSIPSFSGSNYSLNLGISKQGEVLNPFLGNSEIVDEKIIKSTLFTLDGIPMVEIIDDYNLNTRVVTRLTQPNLRVDDGWWDSFNNCMSAVHSPTDSWVVNTLFAGAANFATGGWFSPVAAVACGGVSIFEDIDERTPPFIL